MIGPERRYRPEVPTRRSTGSLDRVFSTNAAGASADRADRQDRWWVATVQRFQG